MRESVLTAATMRWLDELATAGVFTTDSALTIQSWNQWLHRATGREPSAIVGQSLFAAFPDIVSRGLDPITPPPCAARSACSRIGSTIT